jgi:hypothetical protein
MRIRPAVLVAAVAIAMPALSEPPRALAAAPAAQTYAAPATHKANDGFAEQTPPSSDPQQGNAPPANGTAAPLTPEQSKAARDRVLAKINAARAAHGKDKPLTPEQSKAARDRMLAKINAARAAAAPATP